MRGVRQNRKSGPQPALPTAHFDHAPPHFDHAPHPSPLGAVDWPRWQLFGQSTATMLLSGCLLLGRAAGRGTGGLEAVILEAFQRLDILRFCVGGGGGVVPLNIA